MTASAGHSGALAEGHRPTLLAKHHKNIVLHPGTALTFVLSTPATESKATASSAVSVPFICSSCR